MKSLEFIRKHVKTWPKGTETVRLDKDGEICFMGGCGVCYDFYPDGYDESMFDQADMRFTGIEHTREQFEAIDKVEEFVCVWFESTQKWVVVLDNGTIIDDGFCAVGYAVGAALDKLGRGEAEFEQEYGDGNFHRCVKDAEFWIDKHTSS